MDHPNKPKAQAEEKERKKLAPVVSGTVVAKKPSELSRVARAFMAEEATNIGSYILLDVLIPTVKDAILDMLTMIFHGGAGKPRNYGTQRASKISYQPYYDYQKQSQRPDPQQRAPRTGFEFDDLVFPTRGDAEMVLDTMNEAIITYGVVSILDLHDFAGVSLSNYAGGQKYGWTDISGCRAVGVRGGGYILKLPKAVQIN